MKIVIDTRMINCGGIGTYLRNLLPLLQKQASILPFLSNISIYSLREQFQLPWKIPSCDLSPINFLMYSLEAGVWSL